MKGAHCLLLRLFKYILVYLTITYLREIHERRLNKNKLRAAILSTLVTVVSAVFKLKRCTSRQI